MFINIDYNKRRQDAKLHLAKPNKRVISIIDEKFNDNMNIKLGNVNELNFSIPYRIDKNNESVENPHISSIKEKMLIRVTLGTYKEWYIVDSIEEDSNDSNTFNVKAFSLPYELKGKRVSGYVEDSINATSLLTNILKSSIWKIGTVDPMFDAMFRSFDSGDDSNILDCIVNAGETFGALIIWDTIGRKVSFKDATKDGKFRGMVIDYGKFINSIKRTRTTDEMVTRLYVYGSDDLSIQSTNPTGQLYLENFGYFMYPFKRDKDKKVLASSDFMSDELCNALLDHEEIVKEKSPLIKDFQNQLANENVQIITEQSKLTQLEAELVTIQGLLDTANAVGNKDLIAQRTRERSEKQKEIDQQRLLTNALENDIVNINRQLDNLQNQISMEQVFTQELLEELNLYIIESVWRDDRYIDEQELYDDAIKKFDEIRKPKVVIDVTIENLLNIIEEQYYWDKIVLGDLIKVRYSVMGIEYMAKIIQIDYDLQNDEINLTIANTSDLLDDTEKLTQLIYSSANATSIVENNKYKWDKVNYVQKQVNSLLTSEWDATKNKIIAGVNNSVEVGNRGVIIRNPDFPNEVVIMQSGVIALSKDNGETWKTAIKPDGIVAERLIGHIIVGSELLITNQNNSFTLDNNGARFSVQSFIIESSTGGNLVDRWQNTGDFVDEFKDDGIITPYEKRMLDLEFDKILERYNANSAKISKYYDNDGVGLPFVNTYHVRYIELYDYLYTEKQVDKPLLAPDNMMISTTIDRVVFDSRFKNYDSAEVEVEKQLSIRAKELADIAIKDASDAQGRIDEVENDIVYKTELHSTNGNLFSNGNIRTTLYVVVYRGREDITDTLPKSAFLWRKSDENGIEDSAWKIAHTGVGKTIEVTKDDVHRKATFWCDIDIK